MNDRLFPLDRLIGLPAPASGERWLLVGDPASEMIAEISDLLTRHGVPFTQVEWGQLSHLTQERFAVAVCPELFASVRHPLLMLENVCRLVTCYALLHSVFVATDESCARLHWQESTQGWRANRTALARMARAAGFATVQVVSESESNCWIKATRQWPDAPPDAEPVLKILDAFNPVTGQTVFPRSGRHAFLALQVSGLPRTVARWELKLNVGGLGITPILLAATDKEGVYQVNAPLPPGLPLGAIAVQLWAGALRSPEFTIEITEGSTW